MALLKRIFLNFIHLQSNIRSALISAIKMAGQKNQVPIIFHNIY